MRTKLFFGLALVLGLVLMVRATVYSPTASPLTVNNTTVILATNTFWVQGFPQISYRIDSSGGLSTNTQESVLYEYSIDNVNWVTVATFHPSGNGAVTDYWSPATAQQNVYQRLRVVTTTNTSLTIVGQY